MRAVDTNVVVRLLVADDLAQAACARAVVAEGPVFLGTTVALEVAWVLGAAYRLPRARVAEALRAFCGLPTVTVETPAVLAQALDWFDQGMDFADALHLARSGHCDSLLTFDRRFAASGAKAGSVPEVTLLIA